jgi:sulfite reductase (NADPH) hemoprotein beta-component
MAVAAHALAAKTGKAVVHFFASGSDEAQIAEENTLLLERVLEKRETTTFRPREVTPKNLYTDDVVMAHTSQTPPVASDANDQEVCSLLRASHQATALKPQIRVPAHRVKRSTAAQSPPMISTDTRPPFLRGLNR